MHKNATKCNKTQSKWCINKHGASKIIDTFETYQTSRLFSGAVAGEKEDFCRGVSHFQSLYFVIVLLSFFALSCLLLFIKNTQILVPL
jgi:hypothetical protein